MNCKTILAPVLIACCISGNAFAQIDSCNAFLQGNHVEIGISPCGSYGSSVNAPSGYHPHCTGCSGSMYAPCGASTSYNLGFVADPLYTGWATGTGSDHYMGDYFLPGTPFEGWEMQYGGSGQNVQAFNTTSGGFAGTLTGTGSNLTYSTTVAYKTSTWQGVFDSIQVTQITTVDTGALYFNVEVILTNLAVAPKDDIYYFRSLDPDNDETWPGGGFPTTNVIAHQVPDSTVVTATGLSATWSLMALGTTDTNARAVIYDSWPITSSVDLSAIYNETYGTAYYSQGDSVVDEDIAIGLIYHVAHLSGVDSASDSTYRTTASIHQRHSANSAILNFFYAFSQPGEDSALAAFNQTAIALHVKNVNAAPVIRVYPNPASNSFNVSGVNSGDQVSITDMMGRTIMTQGVTNTGLTILQVASIPAGTYLLLVKDVNGNTVARVPVQKQ